MPPTPQTSTTKRNRDTFRLADKTTQALAAVETGTHAGKDVDVLLAQREGAVAELRTACKQEIAAVQQLFSEEELVIDEIFLLRFVLTRDVKTAKRNLKGFLQWLTENKGFMDGMARQVDFIHHFLIELDLDLLINGFPVMVIRFDKSNVPALMNSVAEKNFVQIALWANVVLNDALDTLTRRTRRLTKIIRVLDLRGVGFSHYDRRFMRAMSVISKLAEKQSPELMSKLVVVNPPPFIAIPTKIMMPLLSARLKEKHTICEPSKGPGECCFLHNPALAPLLPRFLGGEAELRACLAGKGSMAPGKVASRLAAGKKEVVKLHFLFDPQHTILLQWSLLVATHDVGFGLQLQEEGKETRVELLAYRRVKAKDGLVRGSIVLAREGTVIATFDNGYSVLTSKRLEYRLQLVAGEGEGAGAGSDGNGDGDGDL